MVGQAAQPGPHRAAAQRAGYPDGRGPRGRLVATVLNAGGSMRGLAARPVARVRRARRPLFVSLATVLAAAVLVAGGSAPGAPVVRAAGDEVRVLGAEPGTLDPAATGDAGSASVIAQLFETVTAIDPSLTVRPALAERWELEDEGRRIVFHLRAGLTFSDGSPLDADDVVRSWLRIIDPDAPSPLSSLMLDVQGAKEYLAGDAEPADVGLRADGTRVEVDLVRPAGDFPSVVASTTFAIVPEDPERLASPDAVDVPFSGGYKLMEATPTGFRLERNDRYWAGPPAIRIVHLVFDFGGRSTVTAFEDGDVDYTGISDFDASWIRFDPQLGPRLRSVPSLSTEYIGFNTTEAPFDDARVRQAFAKAVDWQRLVRMAGTASVVPATSMVPPGTPGRRDRNFLPVYDPDAARALLAEAGFPEGRWFPTVTYLSGGGSVDQGFVTDVERELGIDVRYEVMGAGYFDRLSTEAPQVWSLGWIADYPGANDFLGVLLATGASYNYGNWSNADFDAAIRDAGETTDLGEARAAYDRAEEIVQREVPVVPIAHGPGWALARDGLLGAHENGLGSLRLAGLAWAD